MNQADQRQIIRRIKDEMKRQDLDRSEFGKKLRRSNPDVRGLGNYNLQNFFNNNRLPGTHALIAIAKTLRVSLDWLVFGEGDPKSQTVPDEAIYGLTEYPVTIRSGVVKLALQTAAPFKPKQSHKDRIEAMRRIQVTISALLNLPAQCGLFAEPDSDYDRWDYANYMLRAFEILPTAKQVDPESDEAKAVRALAFPGREEGEVPEHVPRSIQHTKTEVLAAQRGKEPPPLKPDRLPKNHAEILAEHNRLHKLEEDRVKESAPNETDQR